MARIRICWLVSAFAPLLVSCAAQSSSAVAPPLLETTPARHEAPPPHPVRGTLYVSNIGNGSYNQLIGYDLQSLELTYSTDDAALKEPEGISSDRSGAIYVANTYGYNILKFVPPKLSPVMRIADKGYRPGDVAPDSKGNIWVTNWCERTAKTSCDGNVREYSGAGKLLHTITCSNLGSYSSLGIDRNDDVVVDGYTHVQSAPNGAGEIKAGATSCTPLTGIQVGDPGGVEFTENGDVTVVDSLDSIMYTYAKPDFYSIIDTTHLYGIPSPFEDAFVPGDHYIWTNVGGALGVYEFAYPESGYPINYIYPISFPQGVTIVRK